MSGYSPLSVDVALTLLGMKILLAAWCVGCGLIGGVFAPSLFFGATAGVAFHDLLSTSFIEPMAQSVDHFGSSVLHMDGLGAFLELGKTPAYSTVGAAATLGALFRAPLTASMLIFELTQNHDLVLPVLAATGIGGLFAELISRPRRLW
jgi:H+/Cl- antiporter ClcA